MTDVTSFRSGRRDLARFRLPRPPKTLTIIDFPGSVLNKTIGELNNS